ncbi:MAG: nitroreductase [Gemmatimonadetes bacterium]|nr:nitroreductase [Gemmatimonadota bacterium]NNF38344.1 nitroreductase [Gemmatimonadota bacterium]
MEADAPVDTLDAIHQRRSIKRYTDAPVSRDQIESLLEAAVQAPNHRMTGPWRFYVLGAEARAAFGTVLGARKAKRVDDPGAARAVVEKVTAMHRALPAMIVVATTVHENPEIREEDFASAWMAVQNLSLAAHAMGLGSHIKTGAVMDDPAARAAFGVAEDERVVAMIEVGVPEAIPDAKNRIPARDFTTWVD